MFNTSKAKPNQKKKRKKKATNSQTCLANGGLLSAIASAPHEEEAADNRYNRNCSNDTAVQRPISLHRLTQRNSAT
jgi:hypothetical protein